MVYMVYCGNVEKTDLINVVRSGRDSSLVCYERSLSVTLLSRKYKFLAVDLDGNNGVLRYLPG